MQTNNNLIVAVRQQPIDEIEFKILVQREQARGNEVSRRFLTVVKNTPLYEISIYKAVEAHQC